MTFCSNTLSLFAEKLSFFHNLYGLVSGIPLTEARGTQSQSSERAQSLKQKTRVKRESWSLWFPPSCFFHSTAHRQQQQYEGGKKPQKYTQDIAPSHQSVFVVNDMKPVLCFVTSAVCTNITLRYRWKKRCTCRCIITSQARSSNSHSGHKITGRRCLGYYPGST